MIDLLAVLFIAWTILLGIAVGPLRMLMIAAAITGSFFVVTKTAYWIEPTIHSSLITQAFTTWLFHIMERVVPALQSQAIPSLAGGVPANTPYVSYFRSLYVQLIAFLYAAAAGAAVLIAFRSLHTLWPLSKKLSLLQKATGAALGVCTGLYGVFTMLQWLLTYVFITRNLALLSLIHHSLLAHAWTLLRLHGIFERL